MQQEMISLCRSLKIEQSVSHYAIELFDKLFTCLIENAPKFGLMEELPSCAELNSYFGQNIWNLLDLKMRFDSLYLQIDNHYDFCQYGRIICMAICLFIASKQFENKHIAISKLRQFLLSFGVPSQFVGRMTLLSMEVKILNIVKMELNITTLKDYVETLLFVLVRETKLSNTKASQYYFAQEKLSKIHSIALRLAENYFMLQVNFLIKLFQIYQDRTFNLCSLEDIEEVENLSRDKLLIAAIIVAAACILMNPHLDNSFILNHISFISKTKADFIYRGYMSVLKYLFVGPAENQHNGKNVFTVDY